VPGWDVVIHRVIDRVDRVIDRAGTTVVPGLLSHEGLIRYLDLPLLAIIHLSSDAARVSSAICVHTVSSTSHNPRSLFPRLLQGLVTGYSIRPWSVVVGSVHSQLVD
jgi:hypothetical protein